MFRTIPHTTRETPVPPQAVAPLFGLHGGATGFRGYPSF